MVKNCKEIPFGLMDESEESLCTDARRTEACVAPSNLDTSRGGGGCAAKRSILFPFPCSADYERYWLPCKVGLFGLATNTIHVRNNNNNTLPGRRSLIPSFSRRRRCLRVPRHVMTHGISMGADFQDFKGAARMILGNAWHNTFLTERL